MNDIDELVGSIYSSSDKIWVVMWWLDVGERRAFHVETLDCSLLSAKKHFKYGNESGFAIIGFAFTSYQFQSFSLAMFFVFIIGLSFLFIR